MCLRGDLARSRDENANRPSAFQPGAAPVWSPFGAATPGSPQLPYGARCFSDERVEQLLINQWARARWSTPTVWRCSTMLTEPPYALSRRMNPCPGRRPAARQRQGTRVSSGHLLRATSSSWLTGGPECPAGRWSMVVRLTVGSQFGSKTSPIDSHSGEHSRPDDPTTTSQQRSDGRPQTRGRELRIRRLGVRVL
jgi:hypothetical protein